MFGYLLVLVWIPETVFYLVLNKFIFLNLDLVIELYALILFEVYFYTAVGRPEYWAMHNSTGGSPTSTTFQLIWQEPEKSKFGIGPGVRHHHLWITILNNAELQGSCWIVIETACGILCACV